MFPFLVPAALKSALAAAWLASGLLGFSRHANLSLACADGPRIPLTHERLLAVDYGPTAHGDGVDPTYLVEFGPVPGRAYFGHPHFAAVYAVPQSESCATLPVD